MVVPSPLLPYFSVKALAHSYAEFQVWVAQWMLLPKAGTSVLMFAMSETPGCALYFDAGLGGGVVGMAA